MRKEGEHGQLVGNVCYMAVDNQAGGARLQKLGAQRPEMASRTPSFLITHSSEKKPSALTNSFADFARCSHIVLPTVWARTPAVTHLSSQEQGIPSQQAV